MCDSIYIYKFPFYPTIVPIVVIWIVMVEVRFWNKVVTDVDTFNLLSILRFLLNFWCTRYIFVRIHF